jgi:Histidine kinase-, DNA gyrase B-, and HSP90-like ATPase
MTTLLASVSTKILSKVDRLFTNNLNDILIELLQNSRRAGATQVDILTEPSGNGTLITLRDDGKGIDDFSALLRLGDSDWDAETFAREDPAGMGFFSLLHHGVAVTSLDQRTVITRDGFLGREPVEIVAAESFIAGTELRFFRPEKQIEVVSVINSAGRYGRLAIVVDHVAVEREDFLSGALFVKRIDGVRIGVFRKPAWTEWNFHGRLIHRSTPSLTNVLVGEDGHAISLGVRFDVLEATNIRLKLPDRSSIVEDERYAELCHESRIAMYEYLHTLPDHSASFEKFREAYALGVPLREASPWFRAFTVLPADDETAYRNLFGKREGLTLGPLDKVAIVDLEQSPEDPFAFTFRTALDNFENLNIRPVAANHAYRGYGWYDTIPVLTGFALLVNGRPADEYQADPLLNVVETIELSFELVRRDGHRIHFSWSLPFAAKQSDDFEPLLFVTKNSPWMLREGASEPFDLVEAATHLAFSPGDDVESDSYETQLGHFQDEMQTAIIRILGGAAAQVKHELTKALAVWPLDGALREANIREIRVLRADQGKSWTIELVAA